MRQPSGKLTPEYTLNSTTSTRYNVERCFRLVFNRCIDRWFFISNGTLLCLLEESIICGFSVVVFQNLLHLIHRVFQAYNVPRYRAEVRLRINRLRLRGGQEASIPLFLSQRIKATEQCVITVL